MFCNNFHKIFNLFIPKNFLQNSIVRNRIVFTVLLLMLDVLATAAIAYSYKTIISKLALNILDNIWINICLLGMCWIITKTINHFQEIILFPVINLRIKEVTYKMVEHLHNISLSSYEQLALQSVINRIRRIGTSARTFIKNLILTIIPTIIKLIITTWIVINTGIYGFLLIPTLIIGFIVLYHGIKWYTVARKQAWDATDKVIAKISDSIINAKMIRNFSITEMQDLRTLLDLEAQHWDATNNKIHWIHIKVFFVLGICTTCILGGVIYSIKQGKLAVADFVFLKTQLLAVFIPFKSFMLECRQVTEAMVDLKKTIEILEIPRIASHAQNECIYIDYNHIHKLIYLHDIDFSYIKNNFRLKNFNLSITNGEKIIVTGKNGSGKSTLINLIAGIYQPDAGQVLINGRSITSFSQKQLTKKICCIPQDFKLFNDTIWYNITYGLPEIEQEKVYALLNKFTFMNFVANLPMGIYSLVGDMGTNLSAGERQKLAIFRALLINPEILILDETTNAINYEDEQEIFQQLYTRIQTIIIVSHKSGLSQYNHRIINMDQINTTTTSPNVINAYNN